MKKKPLYAIGANIFAGGFTIGVSKHFKVLCHLEHDEYGAEIVRENFKSAVPVITHREDWPLSAGKQRVDFVYANPPCAVWSAAGRNKGDNWKRDPRLQRIKDIAELVGQLRPRAWVWESVCGAFTRGRPFVDTLVRQAAEWGYSATFVFVNAQWHGVPQHRKRFFLLLHDIAIDWRPPEYKTPGDAYALIKDVKANPHYSKLKGVSMKIAREMKPGEGWNDAFNRLFPPSKRKLNKQGRVKHRSSFLTYRLGKTGTIGAVVGAQVFHPTKPRLLSVNELAVLCGFPRSYSWGQHIGRAPSYIARGVCPPVGEWLAENVARSIHLGKKLKTPTTFTADFRKPPGSFLPIGVQLLHVKEIRNGTL